MSKLSQFKQETRQLNLDEVLAAIEAEEISDNGFCPFMAECYESLGLVKQHCAWNYDNPRTWQFCGGYKRRKKGM